MPSLLDVAYAVFVLALDQLYVGRRLKQRMAAGAANAQVDWCKRTVAVQWLCAAGVLLLWQRTGRAWNVLGFVPPDDWRLWVGAAMMVLFAAVVVRQNVRVRRAKPERLARLKSQMVKAEQVLPHDEREYRWFVLVAVTAGVCEELLFRGFLTWVVASYVGTPLAIVAVSVCFGLAHTYLGVKGFLNAAAVGFVLSVVVLASGWLIPAMVIHALIDIAAAVLGFQVLRRQPAPMMAAA